MDFLFATPNGTAAFPAYTKREAFRRGFDAQIATWIKTGTVPRFRYLGPVHPKLTSAMLKANPRTQAEYRQQRDALPVPR
jgi:hypothetical protein